MKILVLNGPNLGRLDLRDSAIYGDLDFAVVVDGQRFRANGYYSSYGPSMVLRKIITEIPDIKKLK